MRLVPRQQLRKKRPSRSKYVVVGGRFVGGGGGGGVGDDGVFQINHSIFLNENNT